VKIGDLIRYMPEWQPACVGVVIGTDESPGKDDRLYVCWSNGDGSSWDFAKYFEKVNE
jgi:hypothetical protein